MGAVNVDLLATADHQPQPDDSTPGQLRHSAGGVGRNIAENLTRLGISVTLISSVGDDEFGSSVITRDKVTGINVDNVSISKNLPTASYTAIHDNNGELLYAISDMRIYDQFEIPAHTDCHQTVMAADAVAIDANMPELLLAEFVNRYQSKLLVADAVSGMKCRRLTGLLSGISLLKVNRTEARVLTGSSATDSEVLIEKLLNLGLKEVLLTCGKEGAVLASGAGIERIAALQNVPLISTSGVGDAMLSGVLAARLYGYCTTEQLRWGVVAAAQTLGVNSACADTLSRQLMN